MKRYAILIGLFILSTATAQAAETVTGTITVDPTLAGAIAPSDVMFITARAVGANGQPGQLLAARRITPVVFPLNYTLSKGDLMMGGEFRGPVNIVARIKKNGMAGPPAAGDLEGTFGKNPATVGDSKVDIVIDKRY